MLHSAIARQVRAIRRADLLVAAGTSLAFYPAAGSVDHFNGDHLAIVNLSPAPRDRFADLCIQAKIGDVFGFQACSRARVDLLQSVFGDAADSRSCAQNHAEGRGSSRTMASS